MTTRRINSVKIIARERHAQPVTKARLLPVTAAPDPAFRWGFATGGEEGTVPVGPGGRHKRTG